MSRKISRKCLTSSESSRKGPSERHSIDVRGSSYLFVHF